jgi:hypothetical protein
MIHRSKLLFVFYVTLGLVALAIIVSNQEREFNTSSFCAYGTVFVEFEEGNRKWGTTLLDRQGKPIPCSETELGANKMQHLDFKI